MNRYLVTIAGNRGPGMSALSRAIIDTVATGLRSSKGEPVTAANIVRMYECLTDTQTLSSVLRLLADTDSEHVTWSINRLAIHGS